MYQDYKFAHCDRLIDNGSYTKICMDMINVIIVIIIYIKSVYFNVQ